MGEITRHAIHRSILILSVFAVLALCCVQASAMQMTSLPKYDVTILLDADAVEPGNVVHVTSHVALIYFQKGADPSVSGIYVDYEVKGPAGTTVAKSAGGVTDSHGYQYADITMPGTPGQYTIVVRAYDIQGGAINGQNETYVAVKAGSAPTVTVSPATATPVTGTPVPPTAVPPTAAPQASKPLPGGLLGNSQLLLIAGAVIVLLVIFLVIIAALAFFLLRRKKKPEPAKPAAPAAPTAPVQQAPPGKFCMHCGAAMPLDSDRCPKCGLAPPSDIDTRACANCGTVLPAPAAKYCYNCGAEQKYPDKAGGQQK